MSILTNKYGQFTDSPVDKQWFLRFDVLKLPEAHRKILNRQPVIKSAKPVSNPNIIIGSGFFIWNTKVMSN